MPTELLTRVNWDLVMPEFTERSFDLAARCRKRGVDYYAISGTRTWPDQGLLYAQGRTLPGKIVTKARPGFSAHNYGIADDWCKDGDATRAGLQPSWNLADYRVLQEEAERLGLESGMSWPNFKEGPHVQVRIPNSLTKNGPVWKSEGEKWNALGTMYKSEGVESVWAWLKAMGAI